MTLVDHVMRQIREYHLHGFEIVGMIGADRSPNCGVETTSDCDREIEGQGVFMEALSDRIRLENLDIPMIGIKNTPDVIEKIKSIM